MKKIALLLAAWAFALTLAGSQAIAQLATPTIDILSRTLMVKSAVAAGTIFSVDVDNREYWLTAKHILTGAEHPPYGTFTEKSITLSMLDPGVNSGGEAMRWIAEHFSVIDPGKDIDIVILAPATPIMTTPSTVKVTTEGPNELTYTLGGDCEFLGFPFGPWRATFQGRAFWLPFVKHCTVSAETDDKMLFLDGLNNKGFSGGPVLYQSGPQQRIVGVISSYIAQPEKVIAATPVPSPNDPGKVVMQPKEPSEFVNVNSGFFVAYDISLAVDAIRKNPIGALRRPN
jgi:hypothetical protein